MTGIYDKSTQHLLQTVQSLQKMSNETQKKTNKKNLISLLPLELLLEIHPFLKPKETWRFSTAAASSSSKLLVSIFTIFKKEFQQWTLNLWERSMETTEKRYQQILLAMKNPSKQLTLSFAMSGLLDHDFQNIFNNYDFHSISFESAFHLTSFPSSLTKKKQLIFHRNDEITQISNCHEIQTFKLVEFSVFNGFVNCSHLYEVILKKCPSLIDVSCLKEVQSLTLEMCHGVSDISPLAKIPSLTIIKCDNVFNTFDSLIDNQRLTAMDLPRVVSFQAFQSPKFLKTNLLQGNSLELPEMKQFLANKESLHFNGINSNLPSPLPPLLKTIIIDISFGLNDVSNWGQLYQVELNGCFKLESLQGLSTVTKIEINNCPNLSDISMLGPAGNKTVCFSRCNKIFSFASLNGISRVSIDNCSSFIDANEVNEVKELTLTSCWHLDDISMLGKGVQSLRIYGNRNITSFQGLSNISFIIFDLPSIQTLDDLKNNHRVMFPSDDIPTFQRTSPKFFESYQWVGEAPDDYNFSVFVPKQ